MLTYVTRAIARFNGGTCGDSGPKARHVSLREDRAKGGGGGKEGEIFAGQINCQEKRLPHNRCGQR